MSGDTLAQHRRELDATLAALVAVREHAEREHDLLGGIVEELAELRRRVERVEELLAAAAAPVELDVGRHSRGVGAVLVSEPFKVVNLEASPPEVIGTYLRTVEDTVEYRDAAGELRHAPDDCVAVVGPNTLVEVLGRGVSS